MENATEKVAKQSFTPISYDKDKQDEITRLIASFNKMATELESRQEQLIQSRKLASIGTFTSGIAHELNNPLNNISITAESLILTYQDMPDEEIDEMIDEILTQTDRASRVVKNLLEFSRTERPFLRNLHIRDVVERTLNLIRNQLIVAHLRVEKDIAGAFQPFAAEAGPAAGFRQYSPECGPGHAGKRPITIRAGLGPSGYIQIDLSDTGTGIPPEALDHIFDPFFTTKISGQGTGLGLSIVYSIIRTHGGYIEVKSEVDKGTTFSIFLPMPVEKDNRRDEIQNSNRR